MDSLPAYNMVVLGATGFTGKEVAFYLGQLAEKELEPCWAIAGRNQKKLECLINQIKERFPKINLPQILIVDISDQPKLAEVCQKSQIILNCIGPYRKHGEAVVKACIENQCHYVDVCGEPKFIEFSILKYHERAKQKGVSIVHACGFDSIPAELGALFTIKQAKARGQNIESIQSFLSISGNTKGFTAHVTTLESALLSMQPWQALKEIRRENRKAHWPLPIKRANSKPKFKKIFYDQEHKRWVIPFPGADAIIVKLSQQTASKENPNTAQPWYVAYITLSKGYKIPGAIMASTMVKALASKHWGRKLLLSFPYPLTLGMISKKGPTAEQMKELRFTMRFKAQTKDGAPFVAEVSGPEPGYVATPILLCQAALCLLNQESSLKKGVFTPGIFFKDSQLTERLIKAGINFKTIA